MPLLLLFFTVCYKITAESANTDPQELDFRLHQRTLLDFISVTADLLKKKQTKRIKKKKKRKKRNKEEKHYSLCKQRQKQPLRNVVELLTRRFVACSSFMEIHV